MKNKKQKSGNSIVRVMLIALGAAFISGIIFMYLRSTLISNGNEEIWNIINALLFQDITEEGAKGLGLLYIIGTFFLNGLQLVIVPLVFTSLILAVGSITDLKKLGRIAYKTVGGFFGLYVAGCIVAGIVALTAKNSGLFQISTSNITGDTANIVEITSANPMSILIAMVPQNILAAFSNNGSILAVVFVACVVGVLMNMLGEKAKYLKKLTEEANDLISLAIDIIINKLGPIAIYSLITRAFALYGLEQMTPVLSYIVLTIVTLLFFLTVGYGAIVAITTRLNPFIFLKKTFKVGLFAFSTVSSAATLPLNKKTNTEELGIKENVADFVLPLGMTINMNASAGTPAVPAAGSILLFTVLNGMGYVNEVALTTYALILAINRPVEMILTSLNVVGDATTSLMVAHSEKEINKNIYYDREPLKVSEIKENVL
uniref:Amino acid transporter n=1 Tax=Batrachochytrium dendrobatidis (strain JAM81 / FGSC 10211) TaxID=684364 RepID=F4PFW0_BATDJ|eukprot:XP_006683493.1 hypothetical protein BATDEDRAFT_93254 [Batrachochytrium dendrobatidis JAM81]